VSVLLASGSAAAQTVLDGSLLLALPVALLAGLVSFASPCVLPLVPGYLAYVSGMAEPTRPGRERQPVGAEPSGLAGLGPVTPAAGAGGRPGAQLLADPQTVPTARLVLGTCLFVAGFSVVFIGISMVAGVAGALLPNQRVLYVVAGAVAVVMGLVFMGVLPFLRQERRPRWRPAVGLAGAPLLGAAFGVGWIPCVGPTLAAVLGLSFVDGGAGRGALLGAAYCVGLGLPFVLVSLGYARGLRALGPLRRHRVAVQRVGGALLVLVGLLLITGLYEAMVELLRAPISRFPVLL